MGREDLDIVDLKGGQEKKGVYSRGLMFGVLDGTIQHYPQGIG
jgi:hypothetical protein